MSDPLKDPRPQGITTTEPDDFLDELKKPRECQHEWLPHRTVAWPHNPDKGFNGEVVIVEDVFCRFCLEIKELNHG